MEKAASALEAFAASIKLHDAERHRLLARLDDGLRPRSQ
jgi:hypothetical protein